LLVAPPASVQEASEISLMLDTTFIRSNNPEAERGWEILIGAAEAETGARCYFGAPLGQRDASLKLIEDALTQVGRSPATRLTAFTDGAPVLRSLAAKVGIRDRPILDWFHIAMRIRHLQASTAAMPTRVPSQVAAKAVVCEEVERMRWKLWHGHPDAIGSGVKQIMGGLKRYRYEPHHARRPAASRVARSKLFALEKYVTGQEAWTTNYAERSRQGKRVGTSLAESLAEHLVNRRMNKSQHMRWSRTGALHLLQVRAAAMNGRVHPVAQRA
jgi:hypothetical protein